MSAEFRRAVENVKNSWFVTGAVSFNYYTTPCGQNFAILVTKGVWYKVRIFLENEYPKLTTLYQDPVSTLWATWTGPIFSETEHWTDAGKDDKIREWTNFFTKPTLQAARSLMRSSIFIKLSFNVEIPSDWDKNPDKYIKRGDALVCKFYEVLAHAAIYLGNGKVAHVSGHGGGKGDSVARRGNLLGDFVHKASDVIQILYFPLRVRSREDVARIAEAYTEDNFRAGEYHLVKKNCQHFVYLCATGDQQIGI